MTEHELMNLLYAHPNGLTVKDASVAANIPRGTIGTKLSRAFLYGKINRRRDPDQKGAPLVYFQRGAT